MSPSLLEGKSESPFVLQSRLHQKNCSYRYNSFDNSYVGLLITVIKYIISYLLALICVCPVYTQFRVKFSNTFAFINNIVHAHQNIHYISTCMDATDVYVYCCLILIAASGTNSYDFELTVEICRDTRD